MKSERPDALTCLLRWVTCPWTGTRPTEIMARHAIVTAEAVAFDIFGSRFSERFALPRGVCGAVNQPFLFTSTTHGI